LKEGEILSTETVGSGKNGRRKAGHAHGEGGRRGREVCRPQRAFLIGLFNALLFMRRCVV